MSSTTTLQGIPYAVGTDAPDGPAATLALAQSVEKKLLMQFASATARSAAFTAAGVTAAEGMQAWLQDKNRYEYVSGAGIWVPMQYGSICRLRNTAVTALVNSTWTVIAFQTEDQDDDDAHSTATNTSRFTAPWTGWYQCSGSVSINVNSTTGRRGAQWYVNGASVNAGSQTLLPAANGAQVPAPTNLQFLTAGDYLELRGFQDSGADVNTNVAAGVGAQSAMNVAWLRP